MRYTARCIRTQQAQLVVIKIWSALKGLNTKIHLAVDANGNPVRIFIAAGTTADCKLGEDLIRGIDAVALLADRGYDTNTIIELARSMGMEIVIPPKKNRKEQREYDKDLYKLRHLDSLPSVFVPFCIERNFKHNSCPHYLG